MKTLNSKLLHTLCRGLLCVGLGACSQMREVAVDHNQWLNWHPALKDSLQKNAVFDFEVSSQKQGRYQLTGTTELPDGSRLAIAAVRYLKLDPDVIVKTSPLSSSESQDLAEINPTLKRLALDPSYTILDYEQVEVQNGAWQTELNLWQVAKDGHYQESWQLHQKKLGIQWQAEPDVIFLATLIVDGAADRLQPIQDQLAEKHLTLSSTLIHTSLEGEQYFQAAQPLSIELPTGQTTPPGLRVQDINGGWGERYLLVEQDPLPGTLKFPTQRNSDAPGSPREFIQ